jgi:hypothetical protein
LKNFSEIKFSSPELVESYHRVSLFSSQNARGQINQKIDKHLDPGLYLTSLSCSIKEILLAPTAGEGMVERYGTF